MHEKWICQCNLTTGLSSIQVVLVQKTRQLRWKQVNCYNQRGQGSTEIKTCPVMLRLDRIETISCIVESEETDSWRSSHPENWTSVQVQEWILWFSLNYLDAGLENVQTEPLLWRHGQRRLHHEARWLAAQRRWVWRQTLRGVQQDEGWR